MPRQKKILDIAFHPTEADNRTAILYQPEKGGRDLSPEERFTMTLTNSGQGDISFVNDGDTVSCLDFYIHDAAKEFTEAEIQSFHLDVVNPDGVAVTWTAKVINNGYNALRISPDQGFELAQKQSVILGLDQFRGTPNLVPRDLYVDTRQIPGAMDGYETLVVVKQVQDGARPLELRANYLETNTVYVSESDTYKTENTLNFYLKNDAETRHSEAVPASQDTFVRLSFDYGNGRGHMDTADYAKDFRLSFFNTFGNPFTLTGAPKDPKNPSWEIQPEGEVFLKKDPDNRLALSFGQVTAHTPGIATLHLEYFNVPGRLDGHCALDVFKSAPDFSIVQFNAREITPPANQPARLRWKVVSARWAELQFKKYAAVQTLATTADKTRTGDTFRKLDGDIGINLHQQEDLVLDLYEDTLFTLTAWAERKTRDPDGKEVTEAYIRDQRQVLVGVTPSLRNFLYSAHYGGQTLDATVVERMISRFITRLASPTKADFEEIITAMNRLGYDSNAIYAALANRKTFSKYEDVFLPIINAL